MAHQSPIPPVPFSVSYWVVEGSLLAGEYPSSLDPPEAEAKLEALLKVGVTSIVNLCGLEDHNSRNERVAPYEKHLATVAERLGRKVEHLRFPIPDLKVPTAGLMEQILNTIDDRIASGEVVYVHCLGGKGRTGTVVGCYLLRHSIASPSTLLQAIAHLRRNESQKERPSPETAEQVKFVESWPVGR